MLSTRSSKESHGIRNASPGTPSHGGADSASQSKGGASALASSRSPVSRRATIVVAGVPFLLILVTFLFWYQTWFGRRLSDSEMGRYLADTSAPRKTQHALSQLARHIAQGDSTVKHWYPQVVRLAGNQDTGLRSMVAWVMGQDNKSEEFHRSLLKLVEDHEPKVRWNAALALVRFGDASGKVQLRLMLQPYKLLAPQAGTVTFRLKEGDTVRSGSIIARIRGGEEKPSDVLSPLAGLVERRLVKDTAKVNPDDEIALVSPGEDQVWESLRGLYLIGTPDDLEDVDRFARGVPGMPDRVRQQAALTAEAIRQRAQGSR